MIYAIFQKNKEQEANEKMAKLQEEYNNYKARAHSALTEKLSLMKFVHFIFCLVILSFSSNSEMSSEIVILRQQIADLESDLASKGEKLESNSEEAREIEKMLQYSYFAIFLLIYFRTISTMRNEKAALSRQLDVATSAAATAEEAEKRTRKSISG